MKTLLLTTIVLLMAISSQAQIAPNELHSTEEALTLTTNIRSLTHFKAPKFGPAALMQSVEVNTSGWNSMTSDNLPDPLALTLYLKKTEGEKSMHPASVVYLRNNVLHAGAYNQILINELKNKFPNENSFTYLTAGNSAKIAFQKNDLKPIIAAE